MTSSEQCEEHLTGQKHRPRCTGLRQCRISADLDGWWLEISGSLDASAPAQLAPRIFSLSLSLSLSLCLSLSHSLPLSLSLSHSLPLSLILSLSLSLSLPLCPLIPFRTSSRYAHFALGVFCFYLIIGAQEVRIRGLF